MRACSSNPDAAMLARMNFASSLAANQKFNLTTAVKGAGAAKTPEALLAYFVDADQVAGQAVAFVPRGDVELELRVDAVGVRPADVERDAGGPQVAINDKMKSAEGPTPLTVTTADLNALFTAGTPSLRSIATAYAQATLDTYFAQFGDAATKTWRPEDVEADGGVDGGSDGGVPTGGKYDNASIVNAVGVDLREASQKVLLDGALYNYALQLASGAVTEALAAPPVAS